MPDVIVIGGGVIGCSVAFRLASAGVSVALLEAHDLASGTSRTSFAWMNSNNKSPLAYHQLSVAGMGEHLGLREEFGVAPWLHIHGNVIWDGQPSTPEPDVPMQGESLEAKFRRLRDWNYPVEFVSRSDVVRSQPDLQPPEHLERAAWFPTEGSIDVPLLVAHLTHSAKWLGARIEVNREVVSIIQESGHVRGVITATGERIMADVVVSCAGRWTDAVSAMVGIPIPMAPTRGMLVTTSKAALALRSLVHAPGVNFRPDGGSRLLMASYDIDALLCDDDSPLEPRDFAQEIFERASSILPGLSSSSVESYVIGVRAIPADGFPAIGRLPGVDGFYIIVSHSGVTLGPLLGRLAADEITQGTSDDRLTSFRPDRFLPQHAVGNGS